MTPEQLAKNNTEDGHQAALFCKVAQNLRTYPELGWLHAIPNGGNRNKVTASRMKATGTKAGVWDIFLPVPSHPYPGLYIEMKKPKVPGKQSQGTLQPNQRQFQAHIDFFGYAYCICYTWEEAWHAIETYVARIPKHIRESYKLLMEGVL
jgi:hypothetical protein